MREKLQFNTMWTFRPGDENIPQAENLGVCSEAKTERSQRGYACATGTRQMSYEQWTPVTLPHDFIISQEPKKENNHMLGYFDYHNGWYRKRFTIDASDEGKRLVIYFEGIATHATIHFNGCLMAHSFCGFTPIEVDITDYAKYSAENVLAVYVNTTESHEGWWYSGGGIYRPAWLIKTDLVSVDKNGVYVHPEKQTDTEWKIPVDVTLRNDCGEPRTVSVSAKLLDSDNNVVAVTDSATATISLKNTADISLSSSIISPKLWDCEHPNLYTAVVTVTDGERVLDKSTVRFGFRTLTFDANEGFFLNGVRTQINGVCCHEDYGLEGKAIANSVKRLRLERLREMGANGYRTAHYPHSDYTFECLAELGFLVMAEIRWFESTKEGIEQLESMVKLHRNNPAVIMWSLGNEEPYHTTPMGKRIFVTLRGHVLSLDATRPVTTAVCAEPAPVMDAVDIIGINYLLDKYDMLHEKYPDKMIFASECCAVGSTRGHLFIDNPHRGYLHCYDNRGVSHGFLSREDTYKFITERKWIGGSYQWTGIEHRGETMWPRLCSQSGALDMFLQKKDAFYQNKSHWTSEPMAHIYPHWNLEGYEGKTVSVWVYTNCDEIELKLNGEILGRKSVEKYGHAEFDVVYTPGKLEAVGYRDGVEVCTDVVETTGSGTSLELELQNKHPLASSDTAVFNCYVRDADGRRVPDASPFVNFDCYLEDNGERRPMRPWDCFDADLKGGIVGTGSDVSDHTPVPSHDRRMRAGIVAVCVRLCGEGKWVLTAKADGLKMAVFELNVKD